VNLLRTSEWVERKNCHKLRVHALLHEHLRRRSHGVKHPVFDFLFEYYSFRSTNLAIWSPGEGVTLEHSAEHALPSLEWETTFEGVELSLRKLNPRRVQSLEWIINLLAETQQRPARFGCHGLHEWAMVYRSPEFRYQGSVPLRLSLEEIARVVETQGICCTHYDAFRFFTQKARPLNSVQPSWDERLNMEQSGCLHVNMDLYKWASKFWPWINSELLADTFELAMEARKIDMRASPYDLKEYGFKPIQIETEQGRKDYEKEQRKIAALAIPLRDRLMTSLYSLLNNIRSEHAFLA